MGHSNSENQVILLLGSIIIILSKKTRSKHVQIGMHVHVVMLYYYHNMLSGIRPGGPHHDLTTNYSAT